MTLPPKSERSRKVDLPAKRGSASDPKNVR